MEIRKLHENELEAFARLGKYAFGNWSDEISPPDLVWFNLDECFALFTDGRMAARLRNRTFTQAIRGVFKPMGGIASVASYPEYRRQGFVRQLMQAAFADMQEKGQVISALYPFREGFYGRFGYVTTNSYLKVKVPTHALEHYLPATASMEDDGWSFNRQRARDSYAEYLPFLRECSVQQHGFVMLTPIASEQLFSRLWENQHVVLLKQHGRIQAAARYHVKGALADGVLSIYEMFWQSLPARDKLLSYFARHADATPACWLNVPLGTNFQSWLHQPTIPFEASISSINMMGRVVDVSGTLNALPAQTDGEICFAYSDAQCPWNNGRYRLTAQNGTLHTEKTTADCQLQLSVHGLSALVFGSLSLAEIVHRGWATAVSEPAQHLLNHWFPPQLAFNTNYF